MELAVREKSAWIPSLLLSLSLAAMGVQAAPDDAGTMPERTDGSRMFIIGSTLMAPYIKDVIEHLSTNAGIPAAIMVSKGRPGAWTPSARGLASSTQMWWPCPWVHSARLNWTAARLMA